MDQSKMVGHDDENLIPRCNQSIKKSRKQKEQIQQGGPQAVLSRAMNNPTNGRKQMGNENKWLTGVISLYL